jgi:hypothetical protein
MLKENPMIDDQSPDGSWAKALKKPKQSERLVQRAIIRALGKLGFRAVHVPNGAQLAGGAQSRARQMNALKGDGLLVGFPDLIIFSKDGRVGFLEVKNEGGKQSSNQIIVERWMIEESQKYAVVRSVDDALATLRTWGWL